MAGTRAGGLKTVETLKKRDPDFYRTIGAKGGKNGHTGGFAANPELARIAGAQGGRVSRRGSKAVVAVEPPVVVLERRSLIAGILRKVGL